MVLVVVRQWSEGQDRDGRLLRSAGRKPVPTADFLCIHDVAATRERTDKPFPFSAECRAHSLQALAE